jgi:hypothetical protein
MLLSAFFLSLAVPYASAMHTALTPSCMQHPQGNQPKQLAKTIERYCLRLLGALARQSAATAARCPNLDTPWYAPCAAEGRPTGSQHRLPPQRREKTP